jgi:hypothetical protein
VEHYLCDDIHDQHCPMCFAWSRHLGDGYKDWDPMTDFTGILQRAQGYRERELQTLARERTSNHVLFLSYGTLIAHGCEAFRDPQAGPVVAVLCGVSLAVIHAVARVTSAGSSDATAHVTQARDKTRSCATCGSYLSKRARRRHSVRYPCGHRAHARCQSPECGICVPTNSN